MNDVINAALADVENLEKRAQLEITDDDLGSIKLLAIEQMRLEDFIVQLGSITSAATKSLLQVQQEYLPDAMIKAEVKSFVLENGAKLSVSKKYVGNISKDNEDAALEWFKSTKRSGVITPNVTLPFAKGHLEEAEKTVEQLRSMGVDVSIKPAVHWQTLRALVRELYENGDVIPECISTFVINEAKITRSKERG